MDQVLTQFPEIETERLRLRKIRQSDLQDMYAIMSDPEVSRHMSWTAHASPEQTGETIQRALQGYETHDVYRWAIARREDDRFIGFAHGAYGTRHRRMELGYWVGRAYWGQGYMTEALLGILRLCFMELPVNRVEAEHYVENPASGRVMEKAGMRFEGMLRQHILGKDQVYRDCNLYAITRDIWLESQT